MQAMRSMLVLLGAGCVLALAKSPARQRLNAGDFSPAPVLQLAQSGKKPAPHAAVSHRPTPEQKADRIPGQQFRTAPPVSRRFDPGLSKHDLKIGQFYFRLGDYRGALSRFRGAYRHDPHNGQALYECGRAAAKLKLRRQAMRYWSHFVEAFPDSPKARTARRRLRKINRMLTAKSRHAA